MLTFAPPPPREVFSTITTTCTLAICSAGELQTNAFYLISAFVSEKSIELQMLYYRNSMAYNGFKLKSYFLFCFVQAAFLCWTSLLNVLIV